MQKGFFKNLIPDYRFKGVVDIPLDFFTGADLVIFDLDNTLVFSGIIDTKPEIIAWTKEIQQRYPCVIFSNSFSFYKRAPRVFEIFGLPIFLSKNKKPFSRLFKQLKQKYQFANEKVFVVGDLIFTDVLFGNRNGTNTILVAPLSSEKNLFFVLLRLLEKVTLFFARVFRYSKL